MAEVLRSLSDGDRGLLMMYQLEREQQHEVYRAVCDDLLFCMGATILQGIWESSLYLRLDDGRDVAFHCIFGEERPNSGIAA